MILISLKALGQRPCLPDYHTVIAKDERIWLDRNLGAARVAVSSDDSWQMAIYINGTEAMTDIR